MKLRVKYFITSNYGISKPSTFRANHDPLTDCTKAIIWLHCQWVNSSYKSSIFRKRNSCDPKKVLFVQISSDCKIEQSCDHIFSCLMYDSIHDYIFVQLWYAILVQFYFWTKTAQLNNLTVEKKCYSIT